MSKNKHPDTIRLKKLLKNLEEETSEPTLSEFRKAIDEREVR